MTPKELLPLRGIILLGLIALFVLFYAKRKGFFRAPVMWPKENPLRLFDVLAVFAIYYGSILLLSPLLLRLFKVTITTVLQAVAYINFTAFALIPLLFFLYFRFGKKTSIRPLLKDEGESVGKDVKIGFLAYLIALPVIFFLSEVLATTVLKIFGTLGPEQNAVRILKEMMGYPKLLIPMVVIIVFVGPFVEEFLFRVTLQGYLRKRLGMKAAILLSSLGFSLLHFSMQQEVGNFILLPMLFVLGLFLGYIYERQRSLASCLFLHILFNAATTSWLIYSP